MVVMDKRKTNSRCKFCKIFTFCKGNRCLCHEKCVFKICDGCMITKKRKVRKLEINCIIGKF